MRLPFTPVSACLPLAYQMTLNSIMIEKLLSISNNGGNNARERERERERERICAIHQFITFHARRV
ncbi:hypothetical protein MPTK1_6g04870 [Marchantia polymorpha subsp. ruderalis]|uniref:Uncharacterized protein n=2 Tax=Marchantia polymorpha TaxID=3197 RepID=A0AAF6BNL3_MARPO|nr:hypothetical protein MARPO_0034s0030 [Marchantia polymorpha]BBN13597.1 hypothetical protein Mp_6g04870 [Marchantia polymorpha subsp. ruderalis]|eukprot:PTQ41433.1 hypothetical protein MARPO_0034s0030 [Marchantia polymorpha]